MDQLFEKLQLWRKFPTYKLEPRTDSMIGRFLHLGIIHPTDLQMERMIISSARIFPEFPFLRPYANTAHTVNTDFLAVSDEGCPLLCEIKTDAGSISAPQKENYLRVLNADMQWPNLLEWVPRVWQGTKDKRKYWFLLHALHQEGLFPNQPLLADNPDWANLDYAQQDVFTQWIEQSSAAAIMALPAAPPARVIYILPESATPNLRTEAGAALHERMHALTLRTLSDRLHQIKGDDATLAGLLATLLQEIEENPL